MSINKYADIDVSANDAESWLKHVLPPQGRRGQRCKRLEFSKDFVVSDFILHFSTCW